MNKNEPPIITLSIQIQYSPEDGAWEATSPTHPNLHGTGQTADNAFLSLCTHTNTDNCNC